MDRSLAAPAICEVGTEAGLIFPALPHENSWPSALRIPLYGCALLYFFMGVAIVSDVFMAAIEQVTSARVSTVRKDGRRRTTKVWNETVATLTLMALGSSAPEIFLSVLDIVKGRFHFTSSLGASTIVGSAAFNLFVIVAVCIAVIPVGEVRIIKNLPAFYITAAFSVIAYLWMAFILLYSSPNVVRIWEALVTFLMLPLLIYISYHVDRGDADGLLRALHLISADVEQLAAMPAKRISQQEGQPQTYSLRRTNSSMHVAMEFTVIWYSRNSGWQVVTITRVEDAHNSYNDIPLHDSRAIFGPDGSIVKSWFLSRAWAEAIKNYHAGLKGGAYMKFTTECLHIPATTEQKTLEVTVLRLGPCVEALSCAYRTESMTAVAGSDYKPEEGMVSFAAGESEKTLELTVYARSVWRKVTTFLIILEVADDEVIFDPVEDGGSESAILTLILDSAPAVVARDWVASSIARADYIFNLLALRKSGLDWLAQFRDVWIIDCDEDAKPSKFDLVLHITSLPWKQITAFLPPRSLCGGWLLFWMSLAYLAILTACVSDLAELFGCVLGSPNIVTAVTFVAMGTSMPDLFASLTAAKDDQTADASVVNVTGSNSVNVFLGLGLPWSIAAIYWRTQGRTAEWLSRYPEIAATTDSPGFVVESSNLGHSVLVFCSASSAALFLIRQRRKLVGAELGGPMRSRIAVGCAFGSYWLSFVALVSWRVLRWGQPDYTTFESVGTHGGVFIGGCIATACAQAVMREEARNPGGGGSWVISEDNEVDPPTTCDAQDATTSSRGSERSANSGFSSELVDKSNDAPSCVITRGSAGAGDPSGPTAHFKGVCGGVEFDFQQRAPVEVTC